MPTRSGSPAAMRLPNTMHQQDQRDRERDALGAAEIGLDGLADLAEHLGATADRDGDRRVVAGELGRQCLDDVVDVVVTAGDDAEHERLACGRWLASGGALPRLQYDATVLPSLSASSSVIFVPSAATAASSTVPSLAVTRSTTLGSSEPNSRCRMAAARSDSELRVGEAAGGQLVGDATGDHERRHHEHGRGRPGWPCASGR